MPTPHQTLPPNPSLTALLLIIRTRSGPQTVFHYPLNPSPDTQTLSPHLRNGTSSPTTASSETSDDDTTTAGLISEDEPESTGAERDGERHGHGTGHVGAGSASSASGRRSVATTTTTTGRRPQPRTLRDAAPEDDDEDDVDDVPALSLSHGQSAAHREGVGDGGGEDVEGRSCAWESVLEYSTRDLEKLLSPSRDLRKKKFEVGVDGAVFLGYPVFIREDGVWRQRKRRRGKGGGRAEGGEKAGEAGDALDDEEANKERNGFEIESNEKAQAGGSLEVATSYRSQGGVSEAPSDAKTTSTSSGDSSNEMTMFHVVFVMNPPPLEYHVRVADMYDNVVKKLAKALKYEQASTGFVWTESKRILELKAQGKQNATPPSLLWSNITQASPLAKLLAHVYSSISASRIAHLPISKTVETSLQIPQSISTPYAPTPIEPQMPGLWLTSASMMEDEESSTALDPNAALLLLQDKEALLKQIETDNRELAPALAYFIRELTPTKSLQKLATRLSLRLPDLQFLARHLIYWRRARAVPPLHIRDCYIVSPNADMRQLSAATVAYERRFPGLPSLPRMLQLLSAKPMQYGFFIPSQDHKQVYMEILAWLLKGGWVTQLRTFAWVKVSPEIKARVAVKVKQEKLKATRDEASKRLSLASGSSVSGLHATVSNDYDGESEAVTSRSNSVAGLLSPMLRPRADTGPSEGSSASNRTAMQLGPSPGLRPSPLSTVNTRDDPMSPLSEQPAPSATRGSSSSVPPLELTNYEQSLVLEPHKATMEESKWLTSIGDSLPDSDLQEAWPTLCGYFDGRSALEGIGAREGWKRSKVSSLVARLEKEGVLCIVRHW